MSKTKPWAIGLIILSTLLNTFAQTMYKFGANQLSFNLQALITNIPLIIGLITYGISAIIMIAAFRGGELSVLYPIFATAYIWVTIISGYIFNEQLNIFKWLGILSIFIGVSLIGLGSKDKALIYKEAI